MNSENSLSQKLGTKKQLNEAINVLKFFNYRIRNELKNRESSANDVNVETPQSSGGVQQPQNL